HEVDRDPDTNEHGLPVVDEDQQLLGVMTHAAIWELRHGNYLPTVHIADVTPKVRAAYPDEPLSRVTDRMAGDDVDCMPVVDPDSGQLVGLLTRHDVLRARGLALREEHLRE